MERQNIKKGPIIHVRKMDRDKSFTFLNNSGILLNLTLARGGYIINIKPMASGILVVPSDIEFMNAELEGIKYPIPIPVAIAKNIQRVRYLSKNPRRFFFAFTIVSNYIYFLNMKNTASIKNPNPIR